MRSALLVIDVQRALFETHPAPYEADSVVANVNTLSRAGRDAGAAVIFIQHERTGSPLAHATPGWRLVDGLEVAEGDHFVRKTTPDAFLRTGLQELLETLGVTRLVICGYASEFCIDTTVRRAAALGFPVTLPSDAHTTHDKPHATAAAIRAHENATLPDLTSFGTRIEVLPVGELRF